MRGCHTTGQTGCMDNTVDETCYRVCDSNLCNSNSNMEVRNSKKPNNAAKLDGNGIWRFGGPTMMMVVIGRLV